MILHMILPHDFILSVTLYVTVRYIIYLKNRFNKGSSDEIDELRNSLGELSDQLDAFGVKIEELSTDMDSQNAKINEDIGSLEENFTSLEDELDITDGKIDEVEKYHKDLRNDFEYLKYDFRSFTNEISKWQIDVDERLSETEDQIQGIL